MELDIFSLWRKIKWGHFCFLCWQRDCICAQFLSYQHISEAPALNRCGSESTFQGNPLSLNRRGSEPALLPDVSVRSWGGARRGSEPAVSSMTQLQMNFGSMSMSFDEEDEHKEQVLTPWHPPNWALSKEFVPQQTLPGKVLAYLMQRG